MPEQNERSYPPRRRRRRRRRINYTAIIFWLVVLLVGVGLVALIMNLTREKPDDGTTAPSTSVTAPSADSTEGSSEPPEASTAATEPEVTVVSSATVAATGDMLMHLPCINAAYNSTTGEYDFMPTFTYLQDYIQAADYAVANLETTLCGEDNGYEYHGYPDFNCPDSIVTGLQSTGFDMLLTANNHCYDTHSVGFHRTQQVMQSAGMDYTGTFADAEDDHFLVKDLNGIKIGMICYTYEDNSDPDAVSPNGRTMTDEDEVLINSFNVNELDTFYSDMADNIAAMETEGAEAIVLYIHWGAEYQLEENSTQTAIAQKMCDLGVDVIVGGHPHVIQPMDLLTSTQDPEQKTLCIYSVGNALSNQRKGLISSISTAHTEDGVLFSFTFVKYSDGTVRVEEADVLPLWVNKYTSDATGKTVYDVLPLDMDIEDWKTQFGLTDSTLTQAQDSYERTMETLSEGLTKIRTYLDSLPQIDE